MTIIVLHTAPYENYNQGWDREEAKRKGAPTVQLSANRIAVKLEDGRGYLTEGYKNNIRALTL